MNNKQIFTELTHKELMINISKNSTIMRKYFVDYNRHNIKLAILKKSRLLSLENQPILLKALCHYSQLNSLEIQNLFENKIYYKPNIQHNLKLRGLE
jgi:hypothetical protein